MIIVMELKNSCPIVTAIVSNPVHALYVRDALGCILLCLKLYAVQPTLQSSVCSVATLDGSGTAVLTDDTVLVTFQGAHSLYDKKIYNIYI